MAGYRRHRTLLTLVASVVIMATALCVAHAHGDDLEFCPPVLAVAGVAVLGTLLPGSRFIALLVIALPLPVLDPTAPPPRG